MLLEVKDLETTFFTPAGKVKAVNKIDFNLDKGKVLGIVGESGSGKSVTAYSVMQILSNPGRIVGGSVKLDGEELVGIGENMMHKVRGKKVSIIFQDPMTSLNPVLKIGFQLTEAIRLHTKRDRKQAKARAIEMLGLVGINEPEKRLKQYPHELSGGMRQRVMIAMALACEPDILIADEPTTALDVTIQAQILALMSKLQKEMGMAIIMITHDLGVIAQMCDEVIVMYAGRIVERGTIDQIFYNPKHEYTKGLLRSIPSFSASRKRLVPIEGTPVDLLNLPEGCTFAPRCGNAMKICLKCNAPEMWVDEDHLASCWINVRDMAQKGEIELNPETENSSFFEKFDANGTAEKAEVKEQAAATEKTTTDNQEQPSETVADRTDSKEENGKANNKIVGIFRKIGCALKKASSAVKDFFVKLFSKRKKAETGEKNEREK